MEIRSNALVKLGEGNEDGYVTDLIAAKARVVKAVQHLALAVLCLG